jgi:acyl-CoA thioester hydrolase
LVSREEPAPRSEFKAWRRLTSRWADNDAYGHVNNTVFYQWFDTAVNAWLVEQGMLDIEHGNPIGLVASTRCSYFAPLAFPTDVDVGLAISRIGKSSIHYRVAVFASGEATCAASGEFVHVLVDRWSRRPVPIPPGWRAKLAAIS